MPGLEPGTSVLSGLRSNHLSYTPEFGLAYGNMQGVLSQARYLSLIYAFMVRVHDVFSPHSESQGPSALGLQLEKERRGRIERYAHAMRGRLMDDVLADVFLESEAGGVEVAFPVIHSEVFGPMARIVDGLFYKYAEWSHRHYVNDRFADHTDRTEWRQAFREVFGEEGQRRIQDIERQDKYRIAPTAGLVTLLETLTYMFARSDDPRDVALGNALETAWDVERHKALYAHYSVASLLEKQRINTEFGRHIAGALSLLAEEMQRRFSSLPSK